jgi:hypothetical protein
MMAHIILPVRKRNDIADLARYANEALWRRRDAYPILVKDGNMDTDTAQADIDAWATIAADWDWCATGIDNDRSARAPRESLAARIAALDIAIERLRAAINAGPVTDLLIDQSECLAALRWWAEQEQLASVGKAPITSTAHFLATVNHEARRREIKHPERIAA